jgi:Flp pilus assembly protein TadD
MRTKDSHLTEAEARGLVSEPPSFVISHDISAHLSTCIVCRRRVVRNVLEKGGHLLNGTLRLPPSAGCPGYDEWEQVAAGLLPQLRAQELLRHASECDACGQQLKEIQECFSDELSAQERAEIAALPLTDRTNRLEFAAQLAAESRKPSPILDKKVIKPRYQRWRTAWVAAAVIAIGVGLISYRTIRRTQSPELLIAQIYAQERPFDLRLVGAPYGRSHRERGASQGDSASVFEKPAILLDAELLVRKASDQNPQDRDTLSAKGRLQLLEHDWKNALTTFNTLLSIDHQNFSALVDRATANFYLEQYFDAEKDLDDALALHPDDPAALFNRAMIYEKMLAYEKAESDWERFRQVEKDPSWLDESAEHLASLKKKR